MAFFNNLDRIKQAHYIAHVNEAFELGDRVDKVDHDNGGTVFMCIEKWCMEQKRHAHAKRPYLVYDKERR
jgi:hypothetical protein